MSLIDIYSWRDRSNSPDHQLYNLGHIKAKHVSKATPFVFAERARDRGDK